MSVALGLVVAALVLAVIGPFAAPHPPDALAGRPLEPPSAAHPLGTSVIGQDILSQLLAGARPAVAAGLAAGAVSTLLALSVGLWSALGRRADMVARSAGDLVLGLPQLPLLLLVVGLTGPSLMVLAIALGALTWPPFARVIRARTLVELGQTHVLAARATGVSPLRIAVRHVLPALAPIAMAKLVLTVQYVVLAEASLAFLGLGDPTSVSWGAMVEQALRYGLLFASAAWAWLLLPPVLAIAALVTSLAMLGTGLDERADPALRTV